MIFLCCCLPFLAVYTLWADDITVPFPLFVYYLGVLDILVPSMIRLHCVLHPVLAMVTLPYATLILIIPCHNANDA